MHKQFKKRKPPAETSGNSANGVHLAVIERVLRSGNPTLIKNRIKIIEDQMKTWSTFFRWPALEASIRADIERLRKALNE